MAWTDQVDQGACYLDQIFQQRSLELKSTLGEWMASPYLKLNARDRLRGTAQTSRPSPQVSACNKETASLNDLLNSTKDGNAVHEAHQDSIGPDVWVELGRQESKVSFQKKPNISYIF